MCDAQAHVRSGPIADLCACLLDQLVGPREQWQGYRQAEHYGLLDREIRGLGAFQKLVQLGKLIVDERQSARSLADWDGAIRCVGPDPMSALGQKQSWALQRRHV